jgi:hypothetical protein
VNALAREEVGQYLNEHFVASFQKIGTFRIVNNQKKGGNVASYFCMPDGRVLHILAGPVDGETMLREARWVVENWKLAELGGVGDNSRLMSYFRKAHGERLQKDHAVEVKRLTYPAFDPTAAVMAALFDPGARGGKGREQAVRIGKLDQQGRVHLLLASYPLLPVGRIYELVFEKILGEKVSTLPVAKVN